MNRSSTHPDVWLTLRQLVGSDAWRIQGRGTQSAVLRSLLTNRSFKPIFTLRLCQAVANSKGPWRYLFPLCRVLHQLARYHAGMDFPWQTSLGAGLSIQHGWSMVINAQATIGNNVTLYHGVTIGRADRLASEGERSTAYPVIEDDVWIGPHAIIVGGITIGRGSRILGGAFVTTDIPPHSVVLGNPAQIARSGCRSDVMNPWPVPESQPHTTRPALPELLAADAAPIAASELENRSPA